jgi:hypothetical protein
MNQQQAYRHRHPQRGPKSQHQIIQVGSQQALLCAHRDDGFVYKNPQFEQARLHTTLDLLHPLLIAGFAKSPQHRDAHDG